MEDGGGEAVNMELDEKRSAFLEANSSKSQNSYDTWKPDGGHCTKSIQKNNH